MADAKQSLKYKTPWRVVSTQQGQYNQFIMDIGMVFDLLTYDDGTYPIALKHTQKRDEKGNLVDEWDSAPVIGKDGVVVHRDFAPDLGTKAIKSGPKKGEVMRFGWMKRVPERTPLGLYPVDENGTIQAQFWSPNVQLPQCLNVGYQPWMPGRQDRQRNHAGILAHYPKPEVEDEESEEAA